MGARCKKFKGGGSAPCSRDYTLHRARSATEKTATRIGDENIVARKKEITEIPGCFDRFSCVLLTLLMMTVESVSSKRPVLRISVAKFFPFKSTCRVTGSSHR